MFLIEFIPFLVSPSPRHANRRCQFNDCGGGDNDYNDVMTIRIRTSVFTILASAAFVASLALASTIPGTQPNLGPRQSANHTIQWQPCAKAPAPSECALFTYVFHNLPSQINVPIPPYTNSVPLDYANPAAGTTQIAMIRFPARTLPRRGSIFMNPGSRLRDLPCANAS